MDLFRGSIACGRGGMTWASQRRKNAETERLNPQDGVDCHCPRGRGRRQVYPTRDSKLKGDVASKVRR
jgi:hypothetical protein